MLFEHRASFFFRHPFNHRDQANKHESGSLHEFITLNFSSFSLSVDDKLWISTHPSREAHDDCDVSIMLKSITEESATSCEHNCVILVYRDTQKFVTIKVDYENFIVRTSRTSFIN